MVSASLRSRQHHNKPLACCGSHYTWFKLGCIGFQKQKPCTKVTPSIKTFIWTPMSLWVRILLAHMGTIRCVVLIIKSQWTKTLQQSIFLGLPLQHKEKTRYKDVVCLMLKPTPGVQVLCWERVTLVKSVCEGLSYRAGPICYRAQITSMQTLFRPTTTPLLHPYESWALIMVQRNGFEVPLHSAIPYSCIPLLSLSVHSPPLYRCPLSQPFLPTGPTKETVVDFWWLLWENKVLWLSWQPSV